MNWDEVVEHATESALRNHCDVFIHQDFSKRYEAYYSRAFSPVETDSCELTLLTVAVVRSNGELEQYSHSATRQGAESDGRKDA